MISPRAALARMARPLVLAAAGIRSMLASPASSSMRSGFQSNPLTWMRSSTSKVAAEMRHVLGAFTPQLVGLKHRLIMRNDPDVAFGLALLRSPIVNLQWTIEGEDDDVVAFVEAVLKNKYRELALAGSLAIHFGNQVVAKEWEVVDKLDVPVASEDGTVETKSYPNALVYKRFKSIDPRTVSFVIDPEVDDWVGIEQNLNGQINRVGPDAVVVWIFRRQDVWGNLGGYPVSDPAYDPWYTKQAIRFLRNKYYERRAQPSWKGRAGMNVKKGGQDIDGFQFMHDVLAAVKEGESLVLPGARDDSGNYVFDADLVSDDKRGDMFQLAIDAEGQQILRAMLITDKAGTSDGTGAFAMAQQHAETMAIGLEGILREWIEVVNEQVIAPLVKMNFGPDRLASAQVRMTGAGISAELKQIYRDILLQIIQSEQMDAGKKIKAIDRFDAVAMAQQLGLPLLSEEDVQANVKEQEDVPIEDVVPSQGQGKDKPAQGQQGTGQQDTGEQ